MAPSAKKLEAALIDATCQVFKAEPDATTVNKVRRQAEENLGMEDGFFAGAQWKLKSKSLIKEYVVSVAPHFQVGRTEQCLTGACRRNCSTAGSLHPRERRRPNLRTASNDNLQNQNRPTPNDGNEAPR